MSLTAAAATDRFRREPDSYIDVGAGAAAHRRFGSGPAVLFVHGWPVSGATFRLLLPHLVDHVTCHVVDLPSAGSSRFGPDTTISIEQHIETVRRVLDHLDAEQVAVVGHDSGGMIARHAAVGHPKVRALGLIDTEPEWPAHWRFRLFLANRHLPGFGKALGWVAGKPAIRRNRFVLGDAFHDRSLIDGEFDEFFLRPLNTDPDRLRAAMKLLDSWDHRYVKELADIHRRLDVPVQLVWGEHDAFFPLEAARRMQPSFPDAELAVIDDAGLFSHEERPAEVAAALLPTLTGERG